jgi:hypothetical protein
VKSFCGVALEMKEPMFCVGLLLGFFGILRTGEICKLLVKDIYLSKEPPTVVVNLGLTKAGARQGSAEIVTISNKFFVGIVQAALLGKKPGDPLFPTGSGQFAFVSQYNTKTTPPTLGIRTL